MNQTPVKALKASKLSRKRSFRHANTSKRTGGGTSCSDGTRVDKACCKKRRLRNVQPETDHNMHDNREPVETQVQGDANEDIEDNSKQHIQEGDTTSSNEKKIKKARRHSSNTAPRRSNHTGPRPRHTEEHRTENRDIERLQNRKRSQSEEPHSSKEESADVNNVKQPQEISISQSPNNIHSNGTERTKLELINKFNVSEKSDKVVCDIQDICQSEDGGFLITDRYNKKLKRFSPSYELISSYRFKETPHSVCNVGSEEVAVSMVMLKKIFIVTIGKKLTVKRSLQTSAYCRGLSFSKELLYVCCGDVTDEGSGSIEVFTKSGKLHCSISSPLRNASLIPVNITVSQDGGYLIYTSCNSNDINVMDLGGKIVKTVRNNNLTVPGRLCQAGSENEIYICGTNNNAVAQFCIKSNWIEAMACEKGRMQTPIGISFDAKLSRLIVSLNNSNDISVFHLYKEER